MPNEGPTRYTAGCFARRDLCNSAGAGVEMKKSWDLNTVVGVRHMQWKNGPS